MSLKHTLTASVVMMLTTVCLHFLQSSEDIRPNKPFSAFPKQIGEWTGTEDRFEDRIIQKLGVYDYFLCNYYSRQTGIQLYIGFYQSQRQGSLIHSPKNCMPGIGWNIIQTSQEELTLPDGSRKANVLKMVLQKGSEKQLMLYWYQSRGRIYSSEYAEKVYLVFDSVMRRRTDGSFVRLIAPVTGENADDALPYMKDFAHRILPLLFEFIPS